MVRYGREETSLSLTSGVVMGYHVELTGLEVNTQYYYRVDATNSNGTTSSPVSTFTTTMAREWAGIMYRDTLVPVGHVPGYTGIR